MSEIPYYFETPVPKYFRDNGWMKNPKMCAFITWAFSRCSKDSHVTYHIQKAVLLDPFEFIFGRRTCALETGLTEDEVRGCIHQLNDTPIGEIIKKTPSKTTNKFSVYKWSIEVFVKDCPQQNPQQSPSRAPAEPHKLEQRTKTIRTTTPTSSSSEPVVVVVDLAKKCKAWLDSHAKKERSRKGEYEKITWGNDWILPLDSIVSLMEKYGFDHFTAQVNYMVDFQKDFDKGKSKKGIEKPLAYLRKACKENYALITKK